MRSTIGDTAAPRYDGVAAFGTKPNGRGLEHERGHLGFNHLTHENLVEGPGSPQIVSTQFPRWRLKFVDIRERCSEEVDVCPPLPGLGDRVVAEIEVQDFPSAVARFMQVRKRSYPRDAGQPIQGSLDRYGSRY